jgi:ubiquinone/menaquinone biosynthesis C-methylase UbiE
MKDPYRNIARFYDRIFDSTVRGLRLAGIMMHRPTKGMNILDVGCGTGSHLELYHRFQCHLHGLDLSPSMINVAKKRLGSTAQLTLGDATAMPYENEKFDLVISMLSLHEMPAETRSEVLVEIKRVLKKEGRILLIDYHPGPYKPWPGWASKIIIFLSEAGAGRAHYRNYRNFLANGGLPSLAAQQGLKTDKQQIHAGGTFINLLACKV